MRQPVYLRFLSRLNMGIAREWARRPKTIASATQPARFVDRPARCQASAPQSPRFVDKSTSSAQAFVRTLGLDAQPARFLDKSARHQTSTPQSARFVSTPALLIQIVAPAPNLGDAIDGIRGQRGIASRIGRVRPPASVAAGFTRAPHAGPTRRTTRASGSIG